MAERGMSSAVDGGRPARRSVVAAIPVPLRAAALMPAAALAVHELRYVAAFGSGAGHELAAQGHAYLQELTPWIVLFAALGLGALLGSVVEAWRRPRPDGTARPAHLGPAAAWLLIAAGLVALYGGQEFLEGLFATGHPGGLTGVFGDGGLWAIPASLIVAALMTLLLRGAVSAVRLIARLRDRERPAPPWRPPPPRPLLRTRGLTLEALASPGAGRAPPHLG